MRRICLTLPTNRACSATITALAQEAAYASDRFDVEVHCLVLDSCDHPRYAEHTETVRTLPSHRRVTFHHLDERAQRAFLERVVGSAHLAKRSLLLELMLPPRLSYGACTNRAFLIAAALGCESVHRRDSDSWYQTSPGGDPVFPIHHELTSLGRPAADAADSVSRIDLPTAYAGRRVAMVGSSFIGEPSVDVDEMARLDPEVHHDVVSLWAPADWSPERKRALVEESFHGAGQTPFVSDHSTLALVDPMRVDMCNIAFHGVHDQVPLPPATDTIGSDYFLLHLVRHAGLPGVLHNRNVVNYHTGERRTDAGFVAYQTGFVKFLLSMLYFNFLYDQLATAGPSLLDDRGSVRARQVAAFARQSMELDQTENQERLTRLDTAYRRLGGRYARVAELLAPQRERLLDEARDDIGDFALLTDAWGELVRVARQTSPEHTEAVPRQVTR